MENIEQKLPAHVGIIMDGNGRWAQARGKKRTFGHRAGSKNVDRIVTHAFSKGVKTLTLYAFSSENWARPKEEVDALMKLLKIYFNKFLKKILKNNVRLNVIGDISVLDEELIDIVNQSMGESKDNTEHILNIAINYGGRQEIVYAVNKLIKENKEITVENVDKALEEFSHRKRRFGKI